MISILHQINGEYSYEHKTRGWETKYLTSFNPKKTKDLIKVPFKSKYIKMIKDSVLRQKGLEDKEVKLHNITIDNEMFYMISNSDAMPPFFMSIVSDSNHWMFISSNGGLSAGRKDSDNAIFPYYTDDKITESYDITGSKSIF